MRARLLEDSLIRGPRTCPRASRRDVAADRARTVAASPGILPSANARPQFGTLSETNHRETPRSLCIPRCCTGLKIESGVESVGGVEYQNLREGL